jgi:hypothetical protein
VTEVRPLRWHDLLFAYRLAGRGTSFDAQLNLTVGDNRLRQALLSSTGRASLYVLRRSGDGGLGQLHYPASVQHARLAYLTPALDAGGDEGLWLSLLDGLTVMGGQRGVASITAEVSEDSYALELLRRADFAIYARQGLWMRSPGPVDSPVVSLRPARAGDEFAIQTLYGSLVPALIKQVEPPPSAADTRYVLDGDTQGLCALVAVYRGPRRVLVEIYLHPEVQDRARDIVGSALAVLRGNTNTIYCRLRRHMGWLGDALVELGFGQMASQAVMVRHTAARVTRPAFKPLHAAKGGLPTTPLTGL